MSPHEPGARAGPRSHAARTPTDVLLMEVSWRVDALRDARLGRSNPHADRVDRALAFPAWRAQVREYLQELAKRGEHLREVCA